MIAPIVENMARSCEPENQIDNHQKRQKAILIEKKCKNRKQKQSARNVRHRWIDALQKIGQRARSRHCEIAFEKIVNRQFSNGEQIHRLT